MLISTQQHPQCKARGLMSLCDTHADGAEIFASANAYNLYVLQEPADVRAAFRNLAFRISTNSTTEEGHIHVEVQNVRDTRLGFLLINGSVHACTDPRVIAALHDNEQWDTEFGHDYIRALAMNADVDGEINQMLLVRKAFIRGGQRDTLMVPLDADGTCQIHVGYVLEENPFTDMSGRGSLRLQTIYARDHWFDASDGSNVLYLGMVKFNATTGSRDEVIAGIKPGLEMVEEAAQNARQAGIVGAFAEFAKLMMGDRDGGMVGIGMTAEGAPFVVDGRGHDFSKLDD